MSKFKILVIDDSALIRKILKEILEEDPDLAVEYAAPKAQLAYDYLEQNKIDLITLDVDMPEIDGIEAAAYMSKKWPQVPILMCSSLTERGADITLRALEQGASDYIPKPTGKDGPEIFKRNLRQKVRALLNSPARTRSSSLPGPKKSSLSLSEISQKLAPRPNVPLAPRALAIGSSTGGPDALDSFFSKVHQPFPVPCFIVQHMPAMFTRKLAERLAAKTGFVIKEGEHNEEVQPEVTYIAPGGKHMVVIDRDGQQFIQLNEGPLEHSCRPAVDVLFRSLGEVYQNRVVAAILTGMGADGSGGTVALQKAGSEIAVQDLDTCVVPSMPRASLEAGSVHHVMPLEEIARLFEQRTAGAFRFTKRAL